MKTTLLVGLIALIAVSLSAADSKDRLTSAAKQLGEKSNYSWTTTTKESDGSPGKLGAIDGKTDTTKVAFLSFNVGGIPVEVYLKGTKGAGRGLEGWQTLDEIAQPGGSAAAIVRFLRSYKTPATQSADLARNLKDLKEVDGVLSGELNEEPVKELLLLGARRSDGQEAPKTSDSKGSAKFWIKDGGLTKYEINFKGKVTTGDRTVEIDRTMTVEIKDIGTTKFEPPAEAQQKMI